MRMVSELFVSSYAHLQVATIAHDVVKNFMITRPAETRVVTSDARRRSFPFTYLGVEVSPALYPSIAKTSTKVKVIQPAVCPSKRGEDCNVFLGRGL